MLFRFLAQRTIDAMERRLDADMSYLRALNAASPRAFRHFLRAAALGRHREVVPAEASFAASLAGVMAEDCGPCVQIVVNLARAGKVKDEVIEAILLRDTARMPADVELAFRFATAIIAHAPEAEAAREAVLARWGEKGVVDLTMAAQINRLYPMIKAGLGYSVACQRVAVGDRQLSPVAA